MVSVRPGVQFSPWAQIKYKKKEMSTRTRKPYIKLECDECNKTNYYIQKPKGKAVEIDNLEPNKFCKSCKKHTKHNPKLR